MFLESLMRSFNKICAFFLVFLLFANPTPIKAQKAFSHGARESKTIALTFDDGPHPRYTKRILDILEKYQISATFFMIGCNVKSYPEVAKLVMNKGHEIGSHTYSHPHMRSISLSQFEKELKQTEDILCENSIPRPKLFRPPEGFRSAEQMAFLENAGYQAIVWSVDTHDWQGKNAGEIVAFVLKNIKGGDIVLFHDYTSCRNTTITALEQLIPQLLKDGYTFVTVSELMC